MVDHSNLHIKNLDPSITSSDLFHAFRHFGHIVSAHVMRNEQTKQSKEFGFVSYSDPNDASKALAAMDGSAVTGKSGVSCTIKVNFHEPKRFRESRLAKSYNSTSPDSSIDEVAAGMSSLSTHVNRFFASLLYICVQYFYLMLFFSSPITELAVMHLFLPHRHHKLGMTNNLKPNVNVYSLA